LALSYSIFRLRRCFDVGTAVFFDFLEELKLLILEEFLEELMESKELSLLESLGLDAHFLELYCSVNDIRFLTRFFCVT